MITINGNRFSRKLIRYSVMLHRYLGIVFGLIILLWCLSGFVMMFVQYPSLSEEERYAYMKPLQIQSCCNVLESSIDTEQLFDSFVIKQFPNGPYLKFQSNIENVSIHAETGSLLPSSSSQDRIAYANQIAYQSNSTVVDYVGQIDIDQWSIIPGVARHSPFDVFELDDPENSRLYFSRNSGELVQQVSYNERTWGWVGAVIHWIYPTIIRQNTQLWIQLIIWLSIISIFMVLVGAILGISRLRHKGHWRSSPYKGRFFWHHYTSLFTGILMLTWLFSGLMSMYPWGLLEGRSFSKEIRNLRGEGFTVSPQVINILEEISRLDLPKDTVELKGVLVSGHLNLIAISSDWKASLIQRFAIHDGMDKEFPTADQLAHRIRPEAAILSTHLITDGDSYYYNHHENRMFPVYRIIYQDGERIYLDALSFDVVAVFDSNRKMARWLYLGLHRGDFFPNLNGSLLWYLSWGGLLLLMTFAVGIGCWLAFRVWQRLLKNQRKSSSRSKNSLVRT